MFASSVARSAFRSSYGPKYHFQPSVMGLNATQLTRLGFKSGLFGGAAGVAVIFYASGIPRVQDDILKKIPFFGGFFGKEIHPADNPF
ncbi:Ubiquinol-cytochrome-c reductase complex subunit (QCR10) [Ceratocystis platani]|uniref:Ubiquinol-cytochrome-c reductase complex subunit (QCR10) n=1 Tax=Ceratocystis fimbriata f. sp. platani TaxID=88771 RepID=A0A0F8CRI2_CERFI|nr:Ubiquinol-cytochrome-c reductase complex subunit (QCR10) [Ceratocystis platani]